MNTKPTDLSVTALYTSAVWNWGNLPNASLLFTKESDRVFKVVNTVLGFVRPFFDRLPSLKHSLLHRHLLIDRLLEQSQSLYVLEIASGLSRRGLTYTANSKMQYVEVDLPHVVERKKKLLERSNAGCLALTRPNWRIIAGDASKISLDAIAPGTAANPLFVIVEGLLMYLDADAQRKLFRSIATHLKSRRGGTLVFDIVPIVEQPKPGIVGRLLERLMKKATGGQAFEQDFRTRHDIVHDLNLSGFTKVRLLEPDTARAEFNLPFPKVHSQQLLFVATVDDLEAK